eukprot:1136982-Pelagomonas_calceolata.AAC.5
MQLGTAIKDQGMQIAPGCSRCACAGRSSCACCAACAIGFCRTPACACEIHGVRKLYQYLKGGRIRSEGSR